MSRELDIMMKSKGVAPHSPRPGGIRDTIRTYRLSTWLLREPPPLLAARVTPAARRKSFIPDATVSVCGGVRAYAVRCG